VAVIGGFTAAIVAVGLVQDGVMKMALAFFAALEAQHAARANIIQGLVNPVIKLFGCPALLRVTWPEKNIKF